MAAARIEELRTFWCKEEKDCGEGEWDGASHYQQPPGSVVYVQEF